MRTDSDCIFCKIVAKDIPCLDVWEDSHTLAFMDINPANRGHVLVIPKEHSPDVYGISDDAIAAVCQSAKRVAKAVREALQPDGINLLQANGPGAAQSVFHFHIHVLPRMTGDELKINWGPKSGDMEDIKAAAVAIKRALG